MTEEITVTPSSGNVFADLGVQRPDEALAKAKERARAEGITVGRWLEAAIQEKLERDSNGT